MEIVLKLDGNSMLCEVQKKEQKKGFFKCSVFYLNNI